MEEKVAEAVRFALGFFNTMGIEENNPRCTAFGKLRGSAGGERVTVFSEGTVTEWNAAV